MSALTVIVVPTWVLFAVAIYGLIAIPLDIFRIVLLRRIEKLKKA